MERETRVSDLRGLAVQFHNILDWAFPGDAYTSLELDFTHYRSWDDPEFEYKLYFACADSLGQSCKFNTLWEVRTYIDWLARVERTVVTTEVCPF